MTSLDYAEPAEQVYRRLRARPWLADAVLALALLGVSVGAFARQAAVIPVSAALAGAVVVRRRYPVAALVAALAIGTVQVTADIGPAAPNSALQLTFADTAILVLLYSVAATRPGRFRLNISEATVKTHIGHIMAKLGLRDRIQIVVYAYETGLVTPQGRPPR